MLIQLCRAHNLYISNEHLGKDKFIGKNTCKNSTVIDYFILSSNVFQLVSEFEVMNVDPMISGLIVSKTFITLLIFVGTKST
jgi:hypothetical protein